MQINAAAQNVVFLNIQVPIERWSFILLLCEGSLLKGSTVCCTLELFKKKKKERHTCAHTKGSAHVLCGKLHYLNMNESIFDVDQ